MEIYIVRHGETVWNANKLLQGNTDIELNENGRALAGETGANLEKVPFQTIFASPLIRAYETACLIRGHRNIPIVRDDRIKELSFGVYEGKNFEELLQNENDPFCNFFKKPECYEPPKNGETFEHLCARGAEFMKTVIEPLYQSNERVMIVAHGAINKAIMCHVKQHSIAHFWEGGLQTNCNVIILNYDGERYEVLEETKIFYEK